MCSICSLFILTHALTYFLIGHARAKKSAAFPLLLDSNFRCTNSFNEATALLLTMNLNVSTDISPRDLNRYRYIDERGGHVTGQPRLVHLLENAVFKYYLTDLK